MMFDLCSDCVNDEMGFAEACKSSKKNRLIFSSICWNMLKRPESTSGKIPTSKWLKSIFLCFQISGECYWQAEVKDLKLSFFVFGCGPYTMTKPPG